MKAIGASWDRQKGKEAAFVEEASESMGSFLLWSFGFCFLAMCLVQFSCHPREQSCSFSCILETDGTRSANLLKPESHSYSCYSCKWHWKWVSKVQIESIWILVRAIFKSCFSIANYSKMPHGHHDNLCSGVILMQKEEELDSFPKVDYVPALRPHPGLRFRVPVLRQSE